MGGIPLVANTYRLSHHHLDCVTTACLDIFLRSTFLCSIKTASIFFFHVFHAGLLSLSQINSILLTFVGVISSTESFFVSVDTQQYRRHSSTDGRISSSVDLLSNSLRYSSRDTSEIGIYSHQCRCHSSIDRKSFRSSYRLQTSSTYPSESSSRRSSIHRRVLEQHRTCSSIDGTIHHRSQLLSEDTTISLTRSSIASVDLQQSRRCSLTFEQLFACFGFLQEILGDKEEIFVAMSTA